MSIKISKGRWISQTFLPYKTSKDCYWSFKNDFDISEISASRKVAMTNGAEKGEKIYLSRFQQYYQIEHLIVLRILCFMFVKSLLLQHVRCVDCQSKLPKYS